MRLGPLVIALAATAGACGEATVADPNPFQCVGMAPEVCERLLEEARMQVPGSAPVSAEIRCTDRICTDQQGTATVRVRFANGQAVDYTSGWASPNGAPPPGPPEPVPAETAPALPSG